MHWHGQHGWAEKKGGGMAGWLDELPGWMSWLAGRDGWQGWVGWDG